jgi:hypothetical protein
MGRGEHPLVADARLARGPAALGVALDQTILVESIGRPLSQPAVVAEDQSSAVLGDQISHRRDDRRPDRTSGQRAKVLHRTDHPQVQGLGIGGVDDGDRPVRQPGLRVLAAEETRRRLHRADGRAEPDPLQRSGGQPSQPLQRERQVGAALVADQGVDLVDDHRVGRGEQQPRPGRGEQQVERLGGGDQNLRRPAQQLLPLVGRRVAGAHRDPRDRQRLTGGLRGGANAGQGHLEVPLDVVVQRLQRRHVHHPHAGAEVAEGAGSRRWLGGRRQFAEEAVQAPQKGGQGLAAAGRRHDQRVLAAGDRRPAGRLRRGWRRPGRPKPGSHRR